MNDPKIWEVERQRNLQNFDELLDSISSIRSKEKLLWKEIYSNAMTDRRSADMMFIKLLMELEKVQDKEKLAQLNMSMKSISDLLSRMERSNSQLIRLAEMVQEAKKFQEASDEENLFRQIDSSFKDGTTG